MYVQSVSYHVFFFFLKKNQANQSPHPYNVDKLE